MIVIKVINGDINMSKIAIKGHSTRGNEVIKILEILGGNNLFHYVGDAVGRCYYIGNDEYVGKVISLIKIPIDSIVFTLEEFLEKFPYKVGDKVQHNGATSLGSVYVIEQMKWEDNQVKYVICDLYLENNKCTVISKDLQQYKEEEMEKEISSAIVDRFICLEGYDFYDDKGNIIDTKEITMKKKKPKYPNTFVECAKTLDCSCSAYIDGYKCELLENLQELLICRDAYWKLSGNWKPDIMYGDLYCIGYDGNVITWKMQGGCRLLVFPTEEMRDAFYENFKELIEECKELL